MTASIWLKKIVLPPAGLLWLGLATLPFLDGAASHIARPLLAGVLVGLYVFGTPRFGLWLLTRLEQHPALTPSALEAAAQDAGAIVVLDAGRQSRAPEYDGHGVKSQTLERLRYGAFLHRRTDLPLLVSGDGAGEMMAIVLDESFGVSTRWVDATSRNTQENADHSATLLSSAGIQQILLVTHAWHMPRALRAFRRRGLQVTPAPTVFSGPERWQRSLLSLLPSAAGFAASYQAMHELVGLGWYQLRYR